MALPIVFLILISSFFTPTYSHLQSRDEAFTSLVISQKGIDFLKDLLVTKAISSIISLKLPQIEKSKEIPFLGNVKMVLSNITIYEINVGSSFVKLGNEGIVVIASETTCILSMNWYYAYNNAWIFPFVISDTGEASVKVEGMQVGLTVGLEIQEGTLKLSLMDCGCFVEEISIMLDGGASWLYQGMIDAFQEQIGSAVGTAITKKLKEGISKLDSFLQSLPREIPVNDRASLNVTFVNDPLLSNSSIEFDINGLFTLVKKVAATEYYDRDPQPLVYCNNPSKMLGISLDEAVFNSASSSYYDADFMRWIVDKIPDQSLLNTAGWRFIVPQLYKKYPNDDMNLNISLSSPPVLKISEQNIDATIYADLIIDVLEADKVVPVTCISLVIRASCFAELSGNNITGSVKLEDFTMSLKWSNIGNLHLFLIQPVVRTILQTVFLPYANKHLGNGFPLPIIHGFTLQNAQLICSSMRLTVCSDVTYNGSDNLSLLPIHFYPHKHTQIGT